MECEKNLNWTGHGFNISDDVREAKLGATKKLVPRAVHGQTDDLRASLK